MSVRSAGSAGLPAFASLRRGSPKRTARRRQACLRIALAIVAPGAMTIAQPMFTGSDIFPPEEFAARRAKVVQRIGDGVAILQGATERPGEQPLRQNNQFFYLTGVVEPRAIALIDGRAKKTAVFLQPFNQRREQRMFGPGLHPGADAARATGLDAVLARDEFAKTLAAVAADGRVIYTPFRPEVLGEASSGDAVALARATKNDPWDGRESREEAFVAKLKTAAPRSEIRDLDPIVDTLRSIKSPREIAVIREATDITGEAIVAATTHARPGMFEYELQAEAERVFKRHGAYGGSYFALIATGTNTLYSHYHRNTAKLGNGDLVQFDYAPDFKYYQSDVTRVFPANGRFSARQREFYNVYVSLYEKVIASIRVHAAARDVIKNATAKMEIVLQQYPFTDARIKSAAEAFVNGYRRSTATSLGHSVGMEVHDVRPAGPTLEPGMIFTIEPAMIIPEEHIGIRLEDMILMTDTGYENLSARVPIAIADIERVMTGPAPSPR